MKREAKRSTIGFQPPCDKLNDNDVPEAYVALKTFIEQWAKEWNGLHENSPTGFIDPGTFKIKIDRAGGLDPDADTVLIEFDVVQHPEEEKEWNDER